MKLRLGYVSNSSSSSFIAYAIPFCIDDIELSTEEKTEILKIAGKDPSVRKSILDDGYDELVDDKFQEALEENELGFEYACFDDEHSFAGPLVRRISEYETADFDLPREGAIETARLMLSRILKRDIFFKLYSGSFYS